LKSIWRLKTPDWSESNRSWDEFPNSEILGEDCSSPNWSWSWWYMCVIQALGRLRQEDHKFEASLDNIERPSQKKKSDNLFICGSSVPFLMTWSPLVNNACQSIPSSQSVLFWCQLVWYMKKQGQEMKKWFHGKTRLSRVRRVLERKSNLHPQRH
jgi:hypothetical protein